MHGLKLQEVKEILLIYLI